MIREKRRGRFLFVSANVPELGGRYAVGNVMMWTFCFSPLAVYTSIIHASQRRRDVEKAFANRLLFQKRGALPVKKHHSNPSTTEDVCWSKVEVVNHGILSAVHQEMSSIPHLEKPPLEPGRSNEAGEKIGECSTFENISGRSLKERSISAKWLGCIFSFLQDVTLESFLHIPVLFAMLSNKHVRSLNVNGMQSGSTWHGGFMS